MEKKQHSRKSWQEKSTATKVRIIVTGILQVSLMVAALWDIRHRADDEIKGSKRFWTMMAFVNFVGPIAYFAVGRKPSALTSPPA